MRSWRGIVGLAAALMSYEEIAQQVGAPLGTVKAQIHHGRRLARPLLCGDG